MTKTNKLILEFNKEKIQEDYDIYAVIKDDKINFFESNILDITKEEFKAVSVVYTYGSKWYVMFKKNSIDKHKLKIALNEEESNLKVEKIDLLQDDIYPNVLAKLLFNSLNIIDDEYSYNNITGKLYYMNKNWIQKDQLFVIEIDLDKDLYINFNVRTFSKLSLHDDKYKKKPKYILDCQTGDLRKKFKNEKVNEENIYIIKKLFSKKKNMVKFLDFISIDKFYQSKMGIYSIFMNDVENELNDYLSIENYTYEGYKDTKFENSYEEKEYKSLLRGRKIFIQDLVKCDSSKELAKNLRRKLKEKYEMDAHLGKLDEDSFNLRIIHNEKYYEENKLEDQHRNTSNDIIIQNLTIENFKSGKVENAAIEKIVQELMIKEDIIKKRISLVNWKGYGYDSPWTFVIRKKFDLEDNKSKYIYSKMKIYEDGSFDLGFFDDSKDEILLFDFWNNEFYRIMETYAGDRGSIEGLIYKDINNINKIVKTKEFIIPNYNEFEEILIKTKGNEVLDVNAIADCVEGLVSDNKSLNKRKKEFLEELSSLDGMVGRHIIKKALKPKSIYGRKINEFINEKMGIYIIPGMKVFDRENVYFDNLLDIKYVNKLEKISYFIGSKKRYLNTSLDKAFIVRDIIADENIEFEDIEKLLKVEFVKNKNYTVNPFPFKYLREAIDIYANL